MFRYIFLCQQCVQVTVQTISSSATTAAVLTSPMPVMGSNTVQTAPMKTSAQTVRTPLFSPFSWRNKLKTSAKSPRHCCLFAVRLVDSNRKSVTHPADLSSLRRPVAQTQQTEGDSVQQTDSKKTIDRPQESSKSATAQGSSQVETQVSQGMFPLKFPDLLLHDTNETPKKLLCSVVM